MKTLSKIIFILCLSIITINVKLHAQNWSPFNLEERFNYRATGANVITASFFTDSVKVLSNDSTFYLNTIIVDLPGGNLALNYQPQFWQRQMVQRAGGDYWFTNPGSMLLQTRAALNYSWLFDTVRNISATVVALQVQNIFSSPDSVKIIALSNGDTVTLSQHYGLIAFPPSYGSVKTLHLTGIEGRNLGELMPNFKSIYSYNVHDVFVTTSLQCFYFSSPPPQYGDIAHVKILTRQETDTSFLYTTLYNDSVYHIYIPCSLDTYDTMFAYNNDTLNYHLSDNPALNYLYCNGPYNLTQAKVIVTSPPMFSKVTLSINQYGRREVDMTEAYSPLNYNGCLTCNDTLTTVNILIELYLGYGEGMGQVSYTQDGGESRTSTYTNCFGNADSTNNSCGDIYPLGVNQVTTGNEILIIDPNPSEGQFEILNLKSEITRIEVYNLLGEKIFDQLRTTQNAVLNIDLTGQPAGIYFCKVMGDDETIQTGKIIIH